MRHASDHLSVVFRSGNSGADHAIAIGARIRPRLNARRGRASPAKISSCVLIFQAQVAAPAEPERRLDFAFGLRFVFVQPHGAQELTFGARAAKQQETHLSDSVSPPLASPPPSPSPPADHARTSFTLTSSSAGAPSPSPTRDLQPEIWRSRDLASSSGIELDELAHPTEGALLKANLDLALPPVQKGAGPPDEGDHQRAISDAISDAISPSGRVRGGGQPTIQ